MWNETDHFPGFVDYYLFNHISDYASQAGMNLRGGFGTDLSADNQLLPMTTLLWHQDGRCKFFLLYDINDNEVSGCRCFCFFSSNLIASSLCEKTFIILIILTFQESFPVSRDNSMTEFQAWHELMIADTKDLCCRLCLPKIRQTLSTSCSGHRE